MTAKIKEDIESVARAEVERKASPGSRVTPNGGYVCREILDLSNGISGVRFINESIVPFMASQSP
jgi:hypothetical protein